MSSVSDMSTVRRWRKSSYSGSEGGDCVEVSATWRTSSHSGSEGGECVEVAAPWAKSSHSGSQGGECVEVRLGSEVAVRDSKNPGGPVLAFPAAAFAAFTDAARSGTLGA